MLRVAGKKHLLGIGARGVHSAAQVASFKIPEIKNEPQRTFAPGTEDRANLIEALGRVRSYTEEIPLVIGGKEIYKDDTFNQLSPYDHSNVVAKVSSGNAKDTLAAIDACNSAKRDWENATWSERASVFLKAAELISNKYRYDMLATTMVGQGKNAYQAEIDSTCELIDFLRFNVKYAEELYAQQPAETLPGIWNKAEYRALEGFVFAVTPFNFTAIAGNLVGAPALMGNTVVWKPSNSAVRSNYLLYKILKEAGLPDGVVNFVPAANPGEVADAAVSHRDFAGLHYTGSTQVFMNLYQKIAQNLPNYRSYPRIVGETGGKNFHVIHKSANIPNAAKNTVRGAFEFQGQKCSATSRVYVSESVWPEFRDQLKAEVEALTIGDAATAEGFHSFSGPVIHEGSFNKLSSKIDENLKDPEMELLVGGAYDKSKGYYVSPTVFVTKNIQHDNLKTEFFGPLATVVVFKDQDYSKTLEIVDQTNNYGLTGAVFANDRAAVAEAVEKLRHSAGNFYINDKCTGAVVAQQWFGGARQSGTNDKAGSGNILHRFVSIRNIKENFNEIPSVFYPSNSV
uniref:Multifunctional fusion protein n=1 Tax=Blastobotrys adeninivorans TaxID=409370 RepID=A0A060T6A1_BLAAD